MEDRRLLLEDWLKQKGSEFQGVVSPLSGDASFRRYFRLQSDYKSYVIMDAPPEKENAHYFAQLARLFEGQEIRVPHVFAEDVSLGFLVLSDFGDRQLLGELTEQSADALYQQAIKTLIQWQEIVIPSDISMPTFDNKLYQYELNLFIDWFLPRYCGVNLLAEEKKQLTDCYQQLIDVAMTQPQILVHRDYHSRNLMLCDDGELGVLDFQDAVWGPVTYDLVSLLRDCYIAWEPAQVEQWVSAYFTRYTGDALKNVSFEDFLRWFDWMGLQRHIKCLGIFSRLAYRDHKESYLKEIPRVLNYAFQICKRYKEFAWLDNLLKRVVHESNAVGGGAWSQDAVSYRECS